MKIKLILIFAFIIISLIIFVNQSISHIQYRSQSEDDMQLTTLLQKISYPTNQNFDKILANKKITFKFTAKHNNLGTISYIFNNYQKINTDTVEFRIKEESTPNWYYVYTYNTGQFNPEYFFSFGFPPIINSRDKKYLVEIMSLSGKNNNSISLHTKSTNYIAKYDYSKTFLTKNPSNIPYFIINKLSTSFGYLPKADINKILINTSIPLIILLLIILNPIKYLIILIKKINLVKIENIFKYINPLLIFTITLLISGYFSTIGADVHHDGIMFKPALDVSQGQILFKDTFTQYGALTTIIQSLVIKIFGEYLIVIKLTTAIFYAFTSVILYFIWNKILNKKLTILSSLIWIFLAPYYVMTFLPWSSVYALFFQCLTLYFYIYYLDQNKTKYLILTGINAGLTFWCKQNVGAYVLAAFITSSLIINYLNNKSINNLFKIFKNFIIGTIIISIPIFVWIIFNGAFIDWWKQSILYALIFVGSKSSISLVNSLFPASIGTISIWALMPIISLLSLLYEFNQKKFNKTVIAISIYSLFSWLQYYPVTCLRHVYWAATPMIGLTIYQIYKLSKSFFKNNLFIGYTFIFLLTYQIFNADIKYRIQGGITNINQNYVYLNKPTILQNMKLNKTEADFYKKTYDEITNYKINNGETFIITTGPNALYLTFDKSENFHKMYINWGNQLYPEYYTARDKYITDNQPLIYAIWEQTPGGYCKFNDLINLVDTSYLVAPCNKIKIKN